VQKRPDIRILQGVVSDRVLEALKAADKALTDAGVPHVLVGALAVGAYGYARASKDVDFLVGDEAFDHHESGLISLKAGLPVEYKGVSLDSISIPPGEEHLRNALEHPKLSEGVPVAPSEILVYMKLRSSRRKDAGDVVELLVAGLEVEPVLAYLQRHAPELIDKFRELVDEAEQQS
jgi:hypothetical protein